MKLTETKISNNIYGLKDLELIKFIRDNFEKNPLEAKDIEALEKLDDRSINLGLGRMAGIKENSNPWWLPIVVTISILIITTVIALLTSSNVEEKEIINFGIGEFSNLIIIDNSNLNPISTMKYILTIAVLFIYFTVVIVVIKSSGRIRITANYFAELLKEIKEDKKNEKDKIESIDIRYHWYRSNSLVK